MTASGLVRDHLQALREAADLGPMLDLACGSGRNGLWLVQQGIPVVFADIRQEALDQVADALPGATGSTPTVSTRLWRVDFEQEGTNPLAGERFGAILVFRYLHRPLIPAIMGAVEPGGLVVYETFTLEQLRFGRPNNPDYLLRPGELSGYFREWDTLHAFEGQATNPDTGHTQAIAQVVARKPRCG